MITSVLGMLVCIACLCSATWAWFSTGISNDSNTVGSGNFGLIVTVVDENGNDVPVSVSADGDSVCTLTGSADVSTTKSYTVTLKMTDDTTVKKGFCNIRSGASAPVQSGSINIDEGTNPFTFTLTVGAADKTLTFEPAWGYPANPGVEVGGTLAIS